MKIARYIPSLLMIGLGILILVTFTSCKTVESKPEHPKRLKKNV